MLFTFWHNALLVSTSSLFDLSSARALYVPKELEHNAAFWASDDFIPKRKRADDTCGAGLDSCGPTFPLDFCCSTGTICLSLDTTAAVTAALCCPAGQDCQTINPVNCDQGLQDASSNPRSQLHSNPTAELDTCGSACCPMGYTCNDGRVCVARSAAAAASSKLSSPTSTGHTSTSSGSATATTASATEATDGSDSDSSSGGAFSGKSFAAGFLPGIALGAFLTACIIYACVRRQRNKADPYVSHEKHRVPGRDTLTDLAPFTTRRPTVHGRSISEPTVDMTMGHRTEFLNSSPPYLKEPTPGSPIGYIITPDAENPPPRKHWLSHSPFVNQARSPVPNQSPIPSHMKRGTLSFQISPLRALKKQRSIHSLRPHVTNATSRTSSSGRNGTSRTDSTETIKVLMTTPQPASSSISKEQSRPVPPPLLTVASWQTAIESTNNTPIDAEPTNAFPSNNNNNHVDETPTRPGRNNGVPHIGATLSSPYTPSNYPNNKSSRHISQVAVKDDTSRTKLDSLWPPAPHGRDSTWRQTTATTFSGMMEKAGLRRSQLLMGPDPREWNR